MDEHEVHMTPELLLLLLESKRASDALTPED